MREQILNLLATGASAEDTIRIVGCSKDYIGELLQDKGFIQELRDARDGQRQELIESGYAKLELSALNSLTKDAAAGMVDTAGLCKILDTAARNRVLYRNPSGHYSNATVHLTVELKTPQAAQSLPVIIDHNTSEIVAIGDRSMAAMPIAGVQKLFKALALQSDNPLQKPVQHGTIPTVREEIDRDLESVAAINAEANVRSMEHESPTTEASDETRNSARAA